MRRYRWALTIGALVWCWAGVALAGGPGVSAGVTRTTLTATGWSGATGVDAGVFATLATFKGATIQPEIRFVRKATERRLGDGVATISSTLKLDYVEVPVLLRVPLLGGRRTTPVVFAGLYGAFRVRATSRTEIGESSYDEDVADEIRRWQSGFVVGAGLEVQRGSVTWLAEARYSQGLTAVSTLEDTRDWRVRSLAILAGVAWRR